MSDLDDGTPSPFHADQIVQCVIPERWSSAQLIKGKSYKVVRSHDEYIRIEIDGKIHGFFHRRFIATPAVEMHKTLTWSLDEIEQAKAMVEDISNGH